MAAIKANNDGNISELFDEALQIYDEITESSEPNNGDSIQSQLIKATSLLEEVTKVVSLVGMFSTNETVEEISTADVKFLLLPALLGALTLRLSAPHKRSEVVNAAEVYFKDFIKRCHEYGVIDFGVPKPTDAASKASSPADNIAQLTSKRSAKIARYKERKEMDARLKELRCATGHSVDEDAKREFYLTLVKSLASQALEELENIATELPLIAHMEAMKRGGSDVVEGGRKREAPPPLRPIIITRDELQKKIYGAGYPSLPTMTVQEFYDQRAKQGDFPDPDAPQAPVLPAWALEEAALTKASREEEEQENRTERDDPEQRARQAGMDEYKDDHRRGWGNRMNRS